MSTTPASSAIANLLKNNKAKAGTTPAATGAAKAKAPTGLSLGTKPAAKPVKKSPISNLLKRNTGTPVVAKGLTSGATTTRTPAALPTAVESERVQDDVDLSDILDGVIPEVKEVVVKSTTNLSLDTDSPTSAEVIGLVERFDYTDQALKYTEEEVEDLKGAFTILAESFDNREMVAQAIPMVMTGIQENPDLQGLLLPEHIGAMVHALRASYSTTIAKKVTRGKKAKPKKASVEEFDNMLGDLDLGDLVI